MTGSELLRLFEAGHRTVQANLEDISHEESMRAPAGGGNSLNWVLGHLVATRLIVASLARGEPMGDDEIHSVYNGQEWASFDPARAYPLERLVALLDQSQESLRAILPGLTDERLAQPALLGTVGETLAFLTFHEGYHSGQLGVLRRTLGKPGKIKPPKRPRPEPAGKA
jgi:uncharacterized damage-inducible protein DinB